MSYLHVQNQRYRSNRYSYCKVFFFSSYSTLNSLQLLFRTIFCQTKGNMKTASTKVTNIFSARTVFARGKKCFFQKFCKNWFFDSGNSSQSHFHANTLNFTGMNGKMFLDNSKGEKSQNNFDRKKKNYDTLYFRLVYSKTVRATCLNFIPS